MFASLKSSTMRFLLIGTVFLLALSLVIFLASRFVNPFGATINTSRTAVIKEMRSLSRLETATFTIEKVIDAGSIGGNIFQQFLFGDKILLIAHGQVIAGFDLSQISENDVTVSGSSVSLKLPPPQILVATLDNTQTKVYDRRRGLLNSNEDLESQVRSAAEVSIRQAACEADILGQARENGWKQLTTLLSALGFETITVEIPQGSCT